MDKKIHIHFGGCGGHYSYLLGISSILQEKYDLSNIIFSGTSAGIISAALCKLNLNIDKMYEDINIPLLTEIQTYKMKSFYNFIPTFKKHFLKKLNENKDIYLKANNLLYCHLTHFPSLNNHIISEFKNNDDLVECMITSCHIPLYSNCFLKNFRDSYYLDGGISNKIQLNDKYTLIEFQTNKWRIISSSHLFISSCKDFSLELFNLGKK